MSKQQKLNKYNIKPRRTRQEQEELVMAIAKHKNMKKVFKGIYSYPTRKILFKIGNKR